MTSQIQSYFRAEKQESYIFLAIGIIAGFIGGSLLLASKPLFYTGLALPMILIGIVQIMTGTTIAGRTERQTDDLEKIYAQDRAAFSRVESQRMDLVMRRFALYFWIELAFVIVGLALVLLNKDLNFAKGMGAGMLAQGTLMLVCDYFAQKRGSMYATFVAQSGKMAV